MSRIFWKAQDYKTMAEWIDSSPLMQDEAPLALMRAAVVASLPGDRQRHIPTVAIAEKELAEVTQFRKAPTIAIVQAAPKDPLEFTISEFDRIKHLLNPSVRIRVLA